MRRGDSTLSHWFLLSNHGEVCGPGPPAAKATLAGYDFHKAVLPTGNTVVALRPAGSHGSHPLS